MTFVNEPVSDADIDRYRLPFEKGSGRYWTRDAVRDYYLWGGDYGNPAFGEPIEGRFHLYIDSKLICFRVEPEKGSSKMSEKPFYVRWGRVKSVSPSDYCTLDRGHVLRVFREALTVFGLDGRDSFPDVCVVIEF